MLRLPSVLAVAAAIPLFARLVAPVTGRLPAMLAAIALAANTFIVTLAATARPYALLLLGTVATTLAMRRVLYRARSGTDGAGDWLVWAALSAVLLYVHLLAVLVIGAQVLVALSCRPRLGRRLVPALALLVAAGVPTAVFLAPSDTLSWLGPATVSGARAALVSALGGRLTSYVVLVVAAVGAVALARRAAVGAPGHIERRLLVALAVVPGAALVSLAPVQNLFVDLYLTPLLVPVFGGVAAGLSGVSLVRLRALVGRLRSPREGAPATAAVAAAALAISLAVVLVGVEARTTTAQVSLGTFAQPQQWREASAFLDDGVRPGDVVVFPNSFYRIVAEYYAARSNAGIAGAGWRRGTPELPPAPWGSQRPYELDRAKRLGVYDAEQTLLDAVNGRSTVWLAGATDPVLLQARDRLLAHGWTVTASSARSLTGVTVLGLTRTR
jgi:hypothetical protein